MMNYLHLWLVAALFASSHTLPPDKMKPLHIIKTRSIDINNAHGLAMETRLDKTVEPTGYRLELEPYLEDALYKGHVSINVTWLEDSDTISVHCAHELEITESEVKAYLQGEAKEPQKIPIKKTSMDLKKPILTLRLERSVPKSSVGYINFSFKASMQTANTESFFKTTYVTEQDVERMVAATQLRPNNARRMFPCFDEPAYKTPFELSVVRPRTMVALSNTPVARTEDINGEPNAVWDHFERTPPMSTYMLGLVIADLEQLGKTVQYTDENGNHIELRVWGRPEYLKALEGVDAKLQRVFGEVANFWQVLLPLRRLDIVALPNYQGVKPADSWGLVIYKESDLGNNVYTQLAHELSYQWLGALVTPAWWSDAHINKALAGYMAAEISSKLDDVSYDGNWPIVMQYSLYYELSKRYPHSRITGMKQETTCFKIELLFRMFKNIMGEETFKKGIRTFIDTKKFDTFTGDDIWNALNEAALADGKIPKDVDVKTVAMSWIDKDRLPLITVRRNIDANSALVTQKVFLRQRPHDVPDAAKMLWWVPIILWRSDNMEFTNTTPIAWMRNHRDLNLVNMPDKEHFIIVNPNEIAPFPVNYDEMNWKLISDFLQSDGRTQIPDQTRAKLLHDSWNLAYAGELSFATALNMTLFLKKEEQASVWDPMFTMIDHIGRHICSCLDDKFRAYVQNMIIPLYDKLDRQVDKGDIENKRNKDLQWRAKYVLCKTGYKPCVQDAQKLYSKWMKAPNPDEGNPVHDWCLCPVFRWGTQKEWDFALQRVINFPPSRTKSERTYLLKTLIGCPLDEYKIVKLLNITLLEGNGNFTESDLFLIFSMLTGSSQGYTALFNFLSKNWDVLRERYLSKTNLWDSLITSATAQFTTQEGLDLVSNFYAEHKGKFGSAQHIIEKSLRNILEEAKWSTENIPVMERWLDNYLETAEMEEDQYEKN